MLYLGFGVGVAFGGHRSGLACPRFAAAALILLVFALVGSRIWYLIGHPKFLGGDAGAAGMADAGAGLYGGLVLSFAVSWPLLHLMGLAFWRFWDGAAVILLVGMAITRIGCLMNGCCCGRETHGPFGFWLPDTGGEWKRRYPTQLFEAVWATMILVVGVTVPGLSDHPGLLFLGSAAAYGIGRAGLELLRADAAGAALPTRINVGFSLVLTAISLVAIAVKLR